MAWTTHPTVLQVRRRSVPVDVVVETLDGFRRHLTGRNAAVLAYYGFLTLFPLLMAATTILGFVLDGDPELQADIVDSALSQIPVIGADLEPGSTIGGNWWALVIGLGGCALGIAEGVRRRSSRALDDIWEVGDRRSGERRHPTRQGVGRGRRDRHRSGRRGRAGGDRQRGRPATTRPGCWSRSVACCSTSSWSARCTATSRRRSVTWDLIWPGAVFTAVLYTVLQFAGTRLVTSTLDDAENVYGTFAATLALLSWLSLHALISLVGAELNAALVRRREQPAATADPPVAPVAAHVDG